MWNFGEDLLEEIDKYKYLGVIAEGGVKRGFKSVGERMKDARREMIRKYVCCEERRI